MVLASLADAALLDHMQGNWRALLAAAGAGVDHLQQQTDERLAAFGVRERELLAQKLDDPTLRSLLEVCRAPPLRCLQTKRAEMSSLSISTIKYNTIQHITIQQYEVRSHCLHTVLSTLIII